jgi:uncharacterized membrane protein YeaQ/YmgE (transglycosylase-associated protein family)
MKMWEVATNNRLFLYIAGLSFKSALAFGTTFTGIIGVFLGEIFTNQWGAAGLAGAIAASVGAFFVFIPRFMEQRRKNVETFSEVKEKEMAHIVSRLADLAEKEKAFLNLQLTEAQYIASLERKSKHDLAGALGAAQDHNQILYDQLKRAGLEPVITLHPVNATSISSRVDEEIKAMRLKSIDAAHRAVNASTDGTATNGKK